MSQLNPIYALLPDWLIRRGVRRILKRLIANETRLYRDPQYRQQIFKLLDNSPLALSTEKANEQHYEVPTEYFQLVLGKHLKYSCCLWDDSTETLDDAENEMLSLYCERSYIKDGESILELGCGWGSLTLFIAERYPNCPITALSNSASQKEYILQQAAKRGLNNIQVITADINFFESENQYDLIVSIEMFEHLRNYSRIFSKINHWLKTEGRLFVHHFCHQKFTYPFATEKGGWMTKNFFADGLMPEQNLLQHYAKDFKFTKKWQINGLHYSRTCQAWLNHHIKNVTPHVIPSAARDLPAVAQYLA